MSAAYGEGSGDVTLGMSHPGPGPKTDTLVEALQGVCVMLRRMRPSLPDSPVLNLLRDMSEEDLAAEVESADKFVRSAQLYYDWVRMGQELAREIGLIDKPQNGGRSADQEQRFTTFGSRPPLRRAVLAVMGT